MIKQYNNYHPPEEETAHIVAYLGNSDLFMSHQVANINHCTRAVICPKQMPTSDKSGSATFFPCFHFILLIFRTLNLQSICMDVKEACILWNIYMHHQKQCCFACMFSGFSCEEVPKCQEGITTTHCIITQKSAVFKTNPEWHDCSPYNHLMKCL